MNLDASTDFTWENLTYTVAVNGPDGQKEDKVLLNSMSGTAIGGRVLAIMGPSGAGKSTLMNAIIGRVQTDADHRLDGCVFLNDTVFTERYKKLVSFVAQDDIVMGKETPFEALYFSCRVRLGLTHEEALERTEDTLTRLHLQKCRDTFLGVPGLIKGVSGGEKKRTNIGNELITNPYVILLDEPTTGLDSVNALRVGQLLQDLAREDKRTVLCTIHSPSSELFAVFDDLLLLAKGNVVYHGPTLEAPAYFASIGYPVPHRTNPSEYFMNLLQLPDEELSKLWTCWSQHLLSPAADCNLSIQPMLATVKPHCKGLDARVKEKGADSWIQLYELTKRSWRLFTRDPGATYGRMVQTLFFAILVGLFFFGMDRSDQGVQDRAGAIFLICVNNIFMSAMSGVAAFPPERAVFLMEQSSENYSAWIYAFAKNLAELPFQIFFPTIFAAVEYFMLKLVETPEQFFIHWFLLVLIANMGYTFGMCAASVFPTAEVSMAVVPIVMLPTMIVAGLFANSSRLDPYWLWLNYISFPRYSFVGLFINEFNNIGPLCSPQGPNCRYTSGEQVVAFYGFDNYTWYECAYALVIYMGGLKVIGAFALYWQGKKRRGNLNFSKNLENREMSPRANAMSVRAMTPQESRTEVDDGTK